MDPSPTSDSQPSRRAAAASNEQLRVIALFVIFAGAGALVATGAPTGISWWDGLLRFVLATTVTIAASQSPRWTWVFIAIVAVAGSGFTLALAFAVVALALALYSYRAPTGDPMIGAAVGGLAMQALLRLPADSFLGLGGFFGLTALAAGIASAVVIVFGYRSTVGAPRRVARLALFAAIALLAVGGLSLAVTGASAQGSLRSAIDASNDGRRAATQGDQPAAVAALTTAAEEFDQANGAVNGPLAAPSRLLPVVAQHLRTLEIATEQGAQVARAGASVATKADLELLRPRDGAVDLALFEPVAAGLVETDAAITIATTELADATSPWLIPPIANQLTDLQGDLAQAGDDATLGIKVLDRLPTILGADRPQRYLALFGTPSESRELGGFIGAYAILEADNGAISLVEVGENADLNDRAAAEGPLNHPDGYPTRYTEYLIEKFPGNITGTPDPLTVARAANDMFPELAGAPIDGIIYLDAFAIQAFVELVGAIKPTALTEPLTGQNTADFFLRQQYTLFPEREERTDFLVFLIEKTFEAVLNRQLPGPERMGEVLGPVARQGRLQVVTFDEDTNNLMRELFLLRDFPRPSQGEDFLSVVQANGASNKLDAYLNRDVTYDVVINPDDDSVRGTVSVELTLDSPSDLPQYVVGDQSDKGLPIGSNRVLLSIYTPHSLDEARVDGQKVPTNNQKEYGFWRYLVSVDVAPNDSATVEFDLRGTVEIDNEYALRTSVQPLVNSDAWTISVTPPDGFSVAEAEPGQPAVLTTLLEQDTRFGWFVN